MIECTIISDKFKDKLLSLNLVIKQFGSSYYLWDIKQDREIFEFYWNNLYPESVEKTFLNGLEAYFKNIVMSQTFKGSVAYKGYLRLQMIYPLLNDNC